MSKRFCAVLLAVWGLMVTVAGCGTNAAGTPSSDKFDSGGSETGFADVRKLPSNDGSMKLKGGGDSGGTGSCKPVTCEEIGAGCGQQGDGCGNSLQCGKCTAPETCGGGGTPNECGAGAPDAGDASTIPMGPLTIAPTNKVLTIPFGQQMPTVTYSAQVGGQDISASFSIDLGQVALINASTGIATPTGQIGGVAHVTATFGMQTVSTPLTVILQLADNGAPPPVDAGADSGNAGGNNGVGGSPAGGSVSQATQTLLKGATTADPALTWLYPYNNTVWPQGVLPPLLQWTAPKTYDSVYIQLMENAFTYQGFFSAPVAGQPFINMPIQKAAWDTLVYSNQGEPVTVTLVLSSGGVAYGPISETWIIAQGTLTGTVYYQSYGTALAINFPGSNGYPAFGGATLAIKHGATSPVLVAGKPGMATQNANCRVCHSVAAGGSALVTEDGNNYNASSSYALNSGNAETDMPVTSKATYAFPAMSPDGTYLFSNTAPIPGISPPTTSGLYSVSSGAALPATGLPAGLSAAVPSFSPDGTHIAFNEYGVDKVSLGVIDFAVAGMPQFSNMQTLHTPTAGTDLFPAFLPTNNAVVFEHETVEGVNGTPEFAVTRDGARGELWWVDLATHNAVALATLNGVGYLPTGPNNHGTDETLDYEPTVNPVASGGYAWVVFTSRRLYGNVATQDPFLSDPRNYNATLSATTKKLWVAAIDLNAPAGTDPSHPAFYLPAQELLAGNSRGYWVVDPCEASGTSCMTGDQCCSGYCGQGDGGGFVCGMQPPGCAVLGNKCTAASDCCGASTGIACIDGYCAQPGIHVDAGVCTPTTCSKLGINCGPAGDGCGGLLECGTCTAPASCGGGGTSGVCGSPKGPP